MSTNTNKKFKKVKISDFNKTGKEITSKLPYAKIIIISLLSNLIILLLLYVIKNHIPPEVPLFYGKPEGGNQLAQKASLALPSLVSLVIIFINSTIAYYVNDEFIKKIMIITGFAITFLSVVTTVKIVVLVGNF